MESQDVRGVDLPRYKVPPVCCAPGCSRYADHAHHVWRRSFLKGDYAWVELPGHLIVGNLVPLCYQHHNDVTGMINGHKAKIVWPNFADGLAHLGGFYWQWLDNRSEIAALTWQPPVHGQQTSVTSHTPFEGPAATEVCPGCRRPLPKKDKQVKDPLRRRKSWSIKVPDDTVEDGALVLDTLVEECARMFNHSDKPNMRYFTVAQALALVVQNSHLLEDSRK